jgi:hypothetical protein
LAIVFEHAFPVVRLSLSITFAVFPLAVVFEHAISSVQLSPPVRYSITQLPDVMLLFPKQSCLYELAIFIIRLSLSVFVAAFPLAFVRDFAVTMVGFSLPVWYTVDQPTNVLLTFPEKPFTF